SSGVGSARENPQNLRNENRSASASSRPGSDKSYSRCRYNALSIVKAANGGRPCVPGRICCTNRSNTDQSISSSFSDTFRFDPSRASANASANPSCFFIRRSCAPTTESPNHPCLQEVFRRGIQKRGRAVESNGSISTKLALPHQLQRIHEEVGPAEIPGF